MSKENKLPGGIMATLYEGVTSYEIAPGLVVRPGEFILTHPGGGRHEVVDIDEYERRFGKVKD
jgi:hypothetical protein